MSTSNVYMDSRLLSQGTPLSLDHIQSSLERVLNPQIERNKYHETKQTPPSPMAVSSNRLEGVYRGLQNAIHERISKIAVPKAAADENHPTIVWSDENIYLQKSYSYLRDSESTNLAYKACERIRNETDRKVHELSTSKTLSPEEIALQQMSLILKTREKIGKIIFAADIAPSELVADSTSVDKTVGIKKKADEIVEKELQKALSAVAAKKYDVSTFSLQDSMLVYCLEESKQIASLLLTSQGKLNLGMVGPIKAKFITANSGQLEYQQGIAHVLDSMDPTWQKAIDQIEIPSHPNSVSAAMIRADFGMLPEDPITKLHCQREVLGALLSQLFQGPVGDCFAVAWAIKKHNEFLLNTMKDYTDIVRDGYLTRMVNGKPDQFFFKNTIADDAMSSQITVNSDGSVNEFNGTAFWNCPNLVAACRQMGIVDLDKRTNAVLMQLFGSSSSGVKTVTWDDVIRACAKTAVDSKHSLDDLLVSGSYGFSLSSNRLLRAWETAFAAMAEARPGDYVRDNINSCVMTVFKGVFASQEQKADAYARTLIEEVKTVFQRTLNDSFRLLYNGSIPLNHVSSDGSSSSGGFELYQRDNKDLTSAGVRIATPEQFRSFVFSALDQTQAAEYAKVKSKNDRAVIDSMLQALHLCASGRDFMKNVLYAYDDANKHERDPVGNYLNLERTPMTSLDGDNPWEVMAIDTGRDFTPDVKTIRPNSPVDLLKWLLGLAKWKESTEHYLSDAIPNEEDSATSPQHAFNIEIEGPEFKNFIVSGLSADAWIKKTLLDTGMPIANAEMDKGAKLLFAQKVREWLLNQGQEVPESAQQEMQDLFSKLNSKVLTVQQFAGRAQDGMVGLLHLNAGQAKILSHALDTLLLQSLPASQARAILQGSVCFAKTNWDSGPKNLFFCCFFNPRTEQIDFGNITEDKEELQVMDQLEWIDNQTWEVDPSRVNS